MIDEQVTDLRGNENIQFIVNPDWAAKSTFDCNVIPVYSSYSIMQLYCKLINTKLLLKQIDDKTSQAKEFASRSLRQIEDECTATAEDNQYK